MNPGEMRDRVTVEYKTEVQGAFGMEPTWATRATVPAKVLDGSARSFNEGGIDVARNKVFVIRPLSGMSMDDRVTFQARGDAAARYYRILDIAPVNPGGSSMPYHQVRCEEITDAGE